MNLLFKHDRKYINGKKSRTFNSRAVGTLIVRDGEEGVNVESQIFDNKMIGALKKTRDAEFEIVRPSVSTALLEIYISEKAEEVGAVKKGYCFSWRSDSVIEDTLNIQR